jgi:DNA repair protein RadC
MPDAIVPSGVYLVEGDELTVTVVLSKNNEQIGPEIVVKGKLSAKESVIRELVERIVAAAR